MNSVFMPRCRTIYPVLARLCALLVAVWLQASPVVRWMAGELHSGNLAAIVVRIGGVSAALLGGVQAVSGVSTSTFDGPFDLNGVVGQSFSFRLNIIPIPNRDMEGFTASGLPPGIVIQRLGVNSALLSGVPTQPGTFFGTVTGWRYNPPAGESVSDTVTFTVTGGATPATIGQQPASIRRLPGTNAVFTVLAQGTEPITYHWRKDSAALGLPSSSILTLTNLTPNSAGTYSVIVSNSAGTQTSSGAVLSIAARPIVSATRVNASVRLAFTGETGVTYRVESATNVATTTWNTVTNLTPVADGPIAVTNTPASSNLFYRLRLLGP